MALSPVITKTLVPPRSADVLRRERLLDFLHEYIDRKLIFISAPAGYGKTTLLTDFAHDTDLTVCWYRLDTADRDLQVFVEGLLASLSSHYPAFGEQTRRALEAGLSLGGDMSSVAGTLVNEMVTTIPEWFVLILDDFHYVEDAIEVTRFLSALLAYQPEHCHLIIASRTVPGTLPFISLAARGEVVGLGQDDLRFTPEEVKALFRQNPDLQLAPEEIERLARESEGWITGIILASHTLRRTGDPWTQARASGQPLYEYLAGEVLRDLDPPLRAFLLASSTLEEMTPTLCRDVLGLEDAEAHLEELERRNLFVEPIGEGEDGFRYHSLFREFLQSRLGRDDPETYRRLHQRAAAWFEEGGQPDRAAAHYLRIGEPEQAARVMDAAAEALLRAGRLHTLIEWAERLPEAVLRAHPRLALSAGKAASRVGEQAQTIRWLDMASAAFRSRGERHLLGMTLAAQALVAFNQGTYMTGIRLADDALQVLPEADSEVAVEALRIQGLCLTRMGRLEEAEQRLREALERCQGLGTPHREILIRAGLAACLHSQGRLNEAVQMLHAIAAAARQLGSPGYLAEVLNDLAYNLYLVGDLTGALQALQEALEIARQVGHRYVEAFVRVSLGEVLRDLGDPKTAVDYLEQGLAIAEELENAFLAAYGREAVALTALQLGDPQQALERAQEAVDLAARQEAQVQAARHRATLGLVQAVAGDASRGLATLKEACASLEQAGATVEASRARLFQAYALQQAGQETAAREALTEALAAYRSTGNENRVPIDGQPIWSFLKEAAGEAKDTYLAAALEVVGDFRSRARLALRRWAEQTARRPVSLRAYGFGPGRVERDGAPVPASEWATATARHLFFYLLSHPPRTREQIGADLWPDLRPSRLPGTFHNTKYRMQQALGINPVAYKEGLYAIREDLDIWYDVAEFERLLERARRSPTPKRMHYIRQALALYQGDFLVDCYADWCAARREDLQRQFLEAVGELADWWVDRGRLDDAIAILRRGLEMDSLREDFHRGLMKAYALKGRTGEAIAQYLRCVAILREELSVEPAPETKELFHAIREGRFPPRDE